MESYHGMDLSQIPAMKPPPGIKPNLQHPRGIGGTIIAVNIALLVSMIICLAIRLLVRSWIVKGLSWDDCEQRQSSTRF